VIAADVTVAHAVRQSALPAAAMSAPLRRVLRPRARLAKALPRREPGKPQLLLQRDERQGRKCRAAAPCAEPGDPWQRLPRSCGRRFPAS